MSIRKKVANLWAPLLQSKGNSTTQPMSQKAVSDELNQLNSDLVAKTNVLSYEEIMASTPPIDLDIGIPNASALKHLKPITSSKTIKVTTSNTLSYIEGLYVTIPANCIFGIQVSLTYNASRPLVIMLSKNNSGEYPESVSYSEPNILVGTLSCSLSSYTLEETTYYVWAKTLESSKNDVTISYWYIQL